LVSGVAANHAIHGHDVGLHDISSDGHEVAVNQFDPIGKMTATRLLASSRKVCRRRFHGSHPLSTRGQELEAERADTGAHIQHNLPIPCPDNGIPQEARRLIGPSPPVAIEVAPGDGLAELTLVSGKE
jgi:hypothetical protein